MSILNVKGLRMNEATVIIKSNANNLNHPTFETRLIDILIASVTVTLGLSAFTYIAKNQATLKNTPGIMKNKKPKNIPKESNKANPKNEPK